MIQEGVRKPAHTMIELIVAIGLLLLVAAFAVPTYQILVSQYQLTEAATGVADFLRLTEQKTVTEQKIYGVTLTAGATSIPQFLYDPVAGTKTNQGILFSLPSNITLGAVNFAGQSDIRFSTAGAPSTSGNLVLTDSVRLKNKPVIVRPSGAILDNQSEY